MDASPNEPVIIDEEMPCPYLPDRVARLPMRLPGEASGTTLDRALAVGDRRSGVFFYRTACPACRACQPLRLDVTAFRPNSTQRRILRRGQRDLRLELGPPRSDQRRVELFNRHRQMRRLGDGELDMLDYEDFLVRTCCETLELAFLHRGRLIAVAICDRGATALSAVYTYFDPDFASYSPGTLAILTQVELCRAWQFRYVYLGFYVAENQHLRYKATFGPHERLIHGTWVPFDRLPSGTPLTPTPPASHQIGPGP